MRKIVLLAMFGLLSACAQTSAPSQPPQVAACAAPLKSALEVNLYFGRDKPGGMVSEAEWAAFLAQEVTPRFPDGLSVINVAGQSRATASSPIERERTKLLIVVVFDPPAHRAKVQAIVEAYNRRFSQVAVFQVEHAVCAGV